MEYLLVISMCLLRPSFHVPNWSINRDMCKLVKRRETKKPEESGAVSEVKHRLDNSVTSLQCACVNKSVIDITMHKRKAPIKICPAAKHPKHNQLRVTNIGEKPVILNEHLI